MVPVITGIVLGLAVGVLNFKLLLRMAGKLAHMDAGRAGTYIMAGYFLRTALYIGLILAAIYLKQINVFGAAGGLLAASFLNLRDRNKMIE
ncbi:ATP synthase subunit I [Bacilliculturomica massiliensis]|uniref:ATP synthase subunit I n=1 Tax=Bacilliculturomica massiliensis TaxID=1917867 RepID=UPI00102F3352|nr:ATP synthase subunit I [Bacilliculturomica massiliensis]